MRASEVVTTWRLGYRPAFDGLRGVAVLLVIGSHLGLVGFDSGGTVGVTMFFALSGYLITALLLQEHAQTGSVSFAAFYLRRALRLLPAFVVVSLVCLILAELRGVQDAGFFWISSVAYFANFVRLAGSHMDVFSHIWSLSIEEQFYLIWPGAMVLLLVWPRRRVGLLVVGVALVIIVARALYWTPAVEHRVYFGTDMRADALLLGAAVALLRIRTVGWLAPVGITVMVLAMMQIDNRAAALTLAALAATLIIIAGGKTPGLSWAPLAHIGRISYGLYLWHYPIVVVGMDILPRSMPLWARILLVIALSVTTAEASHRWIEQPFLGLKGRLARRSSLVTLPNADLTRP